MPINASRLQQHFEAMSAIGKIGETGTCRPAHTTLEKQGFGIAAQWMKDAGMQTHIDNFGNLIGHLKGKSTSLPVLMTGSHLDSQPYGGRFDGVAGVLCAIEAVMTLKENGITPERGIDVISFADEEGWRFNKGLFGSRGILGKLDSKSFLNNYYNFKNLLSEFMLLPAFYIQAKTGFGILKFKLADLLSNNHAGVKLYSSFNR